MEILYPLLCYYLVPAYIKSKTILHLHFPSSLQYIWLILFSFNKSTYFLWEESHSCHIDESMLQLSCLQKKLTTLVSSIGPHHGKLMISLAFLKTSSIPRAKTLIPLASKQSAVCSVGDALDLSKLKHTESNSLDVGESGIIQHLHIVKKLKPKSLVKSSKESILIYIYMYVLMNSNSLINGKHARGTFITMEKAYVKNLQSQKEPKDVKNVW